MNKPTMIECVHGDITRQPDMAAVVNAANAALLPGGGVAGAIHHAAGPQLQAACRPLAPIAPGEAVITPGFQLPNPWVIHCLGPRYGMDRPEAELLARCYRRALDLAREQQLTSVAFPALSAGAFGYPLAAAAQVALTTVAQHPAVVAGTVRVRFVLFDAATCEVFQQALQSLPT